MSLVKGRQQVIARFPAASGAAQGLAVHRDHPAASRPGRGALRRPPASQVIEGIRVQAYAVTRAFWERRGFVQVDTIDPLPAWQPGKPAAIYVAALGPTR